MELKIDPNISYALALEGGGAKGAYQIGVWRALRQAGIRIAAVAGSSVGSLNGAMIAMGNLEKAEELWKNISYSQIMDVDDESMHQLMNGEFSLSGLGSLLAQVGKVILDGGFDITPLQNLIRESVPEEAVRNSETELFIVTYSLTDRKELELRARDLPEGELANMLMASAYFPAFRSEKLGGKRYTDGGVTDVLPLHVLVENGYRNIIAIRLFGPGIERNVRIPDDTRVFTIEPGSELGGTLEFEAEQSEQNMRLGYFDGMRALYGLRGKKYCIDMDCTEDEARTLLVRSALRAVGEESGWTLRSVHEKLLPNLAERFGVKDGDYREMLTVLLEDAADRIGVPEWKIYAETELLSAVGGEGALDRGLRDVADFLLPPKAPETVPAAPPKREWTPESPLRVCLLNDSFPPVVDGVANAVLNYARCLAGKEEYCVVATPDYPDAKDDYSFPVVRYPSIDTTKLAGYRAGNPFAASVVSRLDEMDFDIIHTHCPVASTILARVLRERENVPVVFTYHTKFDIDIENTIHSEVMQEAAVKLLVNNISACDEVWVVSEGAGNNLRSLGYTGDYIVMPNGVDLSRGRASDEAVAELNAKWSLPGDVPVYLFLGRIMWYKGLRIILEGLKRVRESGGDFCMVFVGDGMDRSEVEAFAGELGLADRCRFVGAEKDRDVIRAWYTRADLFLFPSTFDTNGLVVREAAACSLASMLVRGSCAAEGIEDGVTGILIDENAESLAAALTSPSASKEFFRSVGENACREIYLSWEDAVDRARDRYRTVLERWHSGELRHRRTVLDGFFDLTGDISDAIEKARDAMNRYFW